MATNNLSISKWGCWDCGKTGSCKSSKKTKLGFSTSFPEKCPKCGSNQIAEERPDGSSIVPYRRR